MPWVRKVVGELVAAMKVAIARDPMIDRGFAARAADVLEQARPTIGRTIAADQTTPRTVRLIPAADLVVTRVTVLPQRPPAELAARSARS
jgi:hypothetical protein